MERQNVVYMNMWALDLVREKISEVSLEVTRLDKLEHRIINQVGKYLLSLKGSIKHKRFIRRIIMQEIKTARSLYHKQEADLLANLSITNEDGDSVEYDPEDVLANVGSGQLEVKETIDLLAKGDRRKNLILNAWTDGCTDDTELSNLLAEVLPGKATGHLSYIKRFRNECRTELTAQAI